jgi:hypothetical protein
MPILPTLRARAITFTAAAVGSAVALPYSIRAADETKPLLLHEDVLDFCRDATHSSREQIERLVELARLQVIEVGDAPSSLAAIDKALEIAPPEQLHDLKVREFPYQKATDLLQMVHEGSIMDGRSRLFLHMPMGSRCHSFFRGNGS